MDVTMWLVRELSELFLSLFHLIPVFGIQIFFTDNINTYSNVEVFVLSAFRLRHAVLTANTQPDPQASS